MGIFGEFKDSVEVFIESIEARKCVKAIEKENLQEKSKTEFEKLSDERFDEYINKFPFKNEDVYAISGGGIGYSDDSNYIKVHIKDRSNYVTEKIVVKSMSEYYLVLIALSRIYPILDYDMGDGWIIKPIYYFDDKSLPPFKLDDYLSKLKDKQFIIGENDFFVERVSVLIDIWFGNESYKLKENIGREKYSTICDSLLPLKEGLEEYQKKLKEENFRLEEERRTNEQKKLAIQKQEEIIKAKNQAGIEGENEVSYALKYLDNCTVLDRNSNGGEAVRILNRDYTDEAQEYDHIIVGRFGIILIETKAYSGNIEIDENGNWTREKFDGIRKGLTNPIQQIRRHEKVLKSFVNDRVPVNSIICLANSKATISGINNSIIPVVKSDLLVEYIESRFTTKTIDDMQQKSVIEEIKSHLV